jgi:hypothetical protein
MIYAYPEQNLDGVNTSYVGPSKFILLQYQTTQSNIEKKQHQYMYTRRSRRHDCGMNTRLKTSQVRLGRNPTIVEYQTQMSTTRRKTSMLNTYTHYLDVFFSCITQDILDFLETQHGGDIRN